MVDAVAGRREQVGVAQRTLQLDGQANLVEGTLGQIDDPGRTVVRHAMVRVDSRRLAVANRFSHDRTDFKSGRNLHAQLEQSGILDLKESLPVQASDDRSSVPHRPVP